jgi:hypothetical protein
MHLISKLRQMIILPLALGLRDALSHNRNNSVAYGSRDLDGCGD